MTNQVKSGLPPNRRFFKCPTTVTAGMPVLIGTLAGVALNDYDATLGGTTFDLDGTFSLTVFGGDSTSAGNTLKINPGDELFAVGTYDATTTIAAANLTIANKVSGDNLTLTGTTTLAAKDAEEDEAKKKKEEEDAKAAKESLGTNLRGVETSALDWSKP